MTKHGSNLAASALIFSSIYCRKFGRFMFFINRRWHATCHTFRCLVGGMLAQICGVPNCGHGVYASSWPMQRACSLTLAVQRTSCSVGGLMPAAAGCGVPMAPPTLIIMLVGYPGYPLPSLPARLAERRGCWAGAGSRRDLGLIVHVQNGRGCLVCRFWLDLDLILTRGLLYLDPVEYYILIH